MEDLNTLIGKTYKKIDDPTGLVYKINSVDGEFILFENGMRCKYPTLTSTFTEYMDPNMFFNPDRNAGVISSILAEQVSNLTKNGELNTSQIPLHEADFEEIETVEEIIKMPGKMPIAAEFDQSAHMSPESENYKPSPVREPLKQVNPEISILSRVKRSVPFTVEIVVNELVPEREKMILLNDMFQTPMVEFLAEDILDKILRNPEALLDQIKEKLFSYVNDKTTKPKKAKKTVNTGPR